MSIESEPVEVRALAGSDLSWITRIDEEHSGRNRREYFRVKLAEVECDTGVRISLAALVDGAPAGFLLARLYYGEFGLPEPVAMLDTLGVATEFSGRSVARALMQQLLMQLRALGIERLQTEVDWDEEQLMSFFNRAGFRPAPRLCLELPVRSTTWLT